MYKISVHLYTNKSSFITNKIQIYMKQTENMNLIDEKLPRGAKKIIAENTGLSYNTVCRFFKSKKTSIQTDRKIKIQINEIIEEYKIAI